ncbi:hypothetical protein B0H13DRAFT_1879108 [Mycena leptocephala]|nr:hypothetical protein B0H13DRAFT_1879108 [Mycena leptocephala]
MKYLVSPYHKQPGDDEGVSAAAPAVGVAGHEYPRERIASPTCLPGTSDLCECWPRNIVCNVSYQRHSFINSIIFVRMLPIELAAPVINLLSGLWCTAALAEQFRVKVQCGMHASESGFWNVPGHWDTWVENAPHRNPAEHQLTFLIEEMNRKTESREKKTKGRPKDKKQKQDTTVVRTRDLTITPDWILQSYAQPLSYSVQTERLRRCSVHLQNVDLETSGKIFILRFTQ